MSMTTRLALVCALAATAAATSAAAAPRLLRQADIRGDPAEYMPDVHGAAARRYPGQAVEVACVVYTPPGTMEDGRPFNPRFGQCRVVGEAAGLDLIDSVAKGFERRARPMPGVTGEILVKLRIPE